MTVAETTGALLDVWQRGAGAAEPERAALLADLALSHLAPEARRRVTVGQRDAALLHYREAAFGSHVDAVSKCVHCGEPVELDFALPDLLRDAAVSDEPFEIEAAGRRLTVRFPTVTDLEEAAQAPDVETARARLLARCVVRDGGDTPLPDDALAALSEQLEVRDPLAIVRFPVHCPACEAETEFLFDVVTFLWSEIDHWAHTLLVDVHDLARAYGWTEPDILALDPWRRRYYLSLVRS